VRRGSDGPGSPDRGRDPVPGLGGRIFRWNQHREMSSSDCRAYVLPGGFSFQDRVRAGAVGAKERIMDFLFEEAGRGRPVLGICNGAQILVESGLVPGWTPGMIESSLAGNLVEGRSGYLSRWVFLTATPRGRETCPWLCRVPHEPMPVPIAHAEGRFVFPDHMAGGAVPRAGFVYTDRLGRPAGGWPDNPNGSQFDIAGLMNESGNVLAMMPHPERAFWLWQVPPALPGPWGERRRGSCRSAPDTPEYGPGEAVFRSLAHSLGVR
jgi:phosphoribosylformylglycinamidine (FGAM) synthase-like amidotransferase family enzyme